MEQKRDPVFKKVSILYFAGTGLYILGFLFLGAADLEYRMWVNILGCCALFLGLPVWLFVLWFRWHLQKGGSPVFRHVITAAAVLLFLLWSYFFVLCLVFGLQEERKLFGGYVAVNRAPALTESDYDLCKSKGLLFREDANWDIAFEIEYLERKYGQEFAEVPFDRETMLFYDGSGEGIRYGETVPVSTAHRELPVNVVLAGGKLEDDYIDLLTRWYLLEGCKELEIDRPCEIEEDGSVRLYFAEGEDLDKVVLDVQKLMRYALQDEMYEEYVGTIRLFPEGGEVYECIYLSFGNAKEPEERFENNTVLLREYIRLCYERILDAREERLKVEEIREDKEPEPEKAETVPEEEHVASVYETEARLIWDRIKDSEDFEAVEGEFSLNYNAKGNEYYTLGEDGIYLYTLIYDRESKNGACRLYVLYRSPYDAESGTYYHYTDTMTQIVDIYAVAEETGEIISSGKKTWSDPGSTEYREITGE